MKLIRFIKDGEEGCGILEGDAVYAVKDIFDPVRTGGAFKLTDCELLPPCEPSKIVCCGLNYKDHAAEMKLPLPCEPVIFLKAQTAILAPGGTIIHPTITRQLEYEAELGVVISKTARFVSPDEAGEYILGYTCINDVTARDLQHKDCQWMRAKSFDTFAPIGPCIETTLDTSDLMVEYYLNGVRKQSLSTSNMTFNVNYIVSFISQVMTLYPGDVIATGTPPGIGPMKVGDEVEVRITGIGSLVNKVGK